jgi:multicomponent Na+:H+ antiporter subunit D
MLTWPKMKRMAAMFEAFHYLPSAVAIPLGGAVLALLLRRSAAYVGMGVLLLMVLNAAGLTWQVSVQGERVVALRGWQAPLGIMLYADGLSALLVMMTVLIGGIAGVYAFFYFPPTAVNEEGPEQRAYFWPLWLFLLAALCALFLSRDIFNLYVTLELMGLSAVPLVALGGDPAALRASMRYLLVSMGGSLFFLLGVALIYTNYGVLDLTALAQVVQPGPGPLTAMSLMTAGLMMKTALFPLHFWLPPAHANAPAPVSAVLSGLVVKASFYIIVRLWLDVFDVLVSPAVMQFIGLLGALAILWGALQAMKQQRIKLLVAYSTVAQIGYLFLLFPLLQPGPAGGLAWSGAFYFVLAHAFAKSGMFLAAGNIYYALKNDRISELRDITQHLPVSTFAFGLASISLVGLPPSGGFIAKWLLISAAIESGQWWWAVVIAGGGLLAAGYLLRVLPYAFLQVPDMPAPRLLPPSTEWAALSLSLIAFALGLLSIYPLELLQASTPVFAQILNGGLP